MWCNPVGEPGSRNYPPGNWRVSNPFLSYYRLGSGMAYHTGDDINLPGVADVNEPVRAVGDGIVTFAQVLSATTWLGLVVIRHELEARAVYTRYAHLRSLTVARGQRVQAGDVIGVIAPTAGTVATFEPHLHFDVSKAGDDTLERRPTDWPGLQKAFIEAHYQNPTAFMRARLAGAEEQEEQVALELKTYKVIATPSLGLRQWPDIDSTRLASMPAGSIVTASGQIKAHEDGYDWTYVRWGSLSGWCAVASTTGQAWLQDFHFLVPESPHGTD